MTDFSTFVFKITKLKIDANPFASAYRRDGLHGQAKRYVLLRICKFTMLRGTPDVKYSYSDEKVVLAIRGGKKESDFKRYQRIN